MIYLFLYIISLFLIWYVYRFGWLETLKKIVTILVPSFLIILFNIKTGRLLFKTPTVGILSVVPTSIFIFRFSQPIVSIILRWIENKGEETRNKENVIDTDSIPLDD